MKRVFIMSLLCVSSISLASDDHNHEAAVEPAPHGGLLREASPYKSELVLEGDLAKIYVYNKDLKPATIASASLKGEVQFPKEKKRTAVTFVKNGETFEATIKGIKKAHRFDLHVTLNEGGKKILIDFGIDNIH